LTFCTWFLAVAVVKFDSLLQSIMKLPFGAHKTHISCLLLYQLHAELLLLSCRAFYFTTAKLHFKRYIYDALLWVWLFQTTREQVYVLVSVWFTTY